MSDAYPNSGTLARNDRKEQPKHPDHRGQATITCPHCNHAADWWISAWVRTSKAKGNKFFSLAFKPKESDASKPAENKARLKEKVAKATEGEGEYQAPDDDVPF